MSNLSFSSVVVDTACDDYEEELAVGAYTMYTEVSEVLHQYLGAGGAGGDSANFSKHGKLIDMDRICIGWYDTAIFLDTGGEGHYTPQFTTTLTDDDRQHSICLNS